MVLGGPLWSLVPREYENSNLENESHIRDSFKIKTEFGIHFSLWIYGWLKRLLNCL
jgi:hypothetical protein